MINCPTFTSVCSFCSEKNCVPDVPPKSHFIFSKDVDERIQKSTKGFLKIHLTKCSKIKFSDNILIHSLLPLNKNPLRYEKQI